MVSNDSEFVERRMYRRLDLILPIAFEILEEDTKDCSINFARTCNVSTGGAYFESAAEIDIKANDKLKIVFDTPNLASEFDMTNVFKAPKLETIAQVVRVNDRVEQDDAADIAIRKQGVAIRFDEELKILF